MRWWHWPRPRCPRPGRAGRPPAVGEDQRRRRAPGDQYLRGRRVPGEPVAALERAVCRAGQPAGAVRAAAPRQPGTVRRPVQRGRHVVSSSPERLVSVHAGHAQTRPIAGTRPRFEGDDDAARIQELVGHPRSAPST